MKTIILIAALMGETGTQPNMAVIMADMTSAECVAMQKGLRDGMPNHTLMCADAADSRLDALNIAGL